MPIRKYRPTSPGQRFQTVQTFEEITTREPYKPLLESRARLRRTQQRGRITSRHRGGGHKRRLPPIDFKRNSAGFPPSSRRSNTIRIARRNIALLHYADGVKTYILRRTG